MTVPGSFLNRGRSWPGSLVPNYLFFLKKLKRFSRSRSLPSLLRSTTGPSAPTGDTGGIVMARVMPRVALGTVGSSGSPEAEDAVAMAAFTTRSHELISACRGRKDNRSASRPLRRGRQPWPAGKLGRRRQENGLTISCHRRKSPLRTGNAFWCGLHRHPGGTLWAV